MPYPLPLTSPATDRLVLGADALRYVMAYSTLSVPTPAPLAAETVGVAALRVRLVDKVRHDIHPRALASINRALDQIAATLRVRARLDSTPPLPNPPIGVDLPPFQGGTRVPIHPSPIPLIPSASLVRPRLDF